MPYAPVLNPFVPEALEQGFSSFGKALDRQQAMQQQQQQFNASQATRRYEADLGYYGGEANRAVDYYGIVERSKEAAARMNPARIQPQPLLDPQGNPLEGMYGIPMTGQVIQTKTQTPGQVLDSANVAQPVYKPDGKTVYGYKIQVNGKETFKEAKPDTDLDLGAGASGSAGGMAPALMQLIKERDELQAKVNAKDEYPGPDWLGIGTPRSAQLAEVQRKLAAAQPRPAAAPSAPASARPAPRATPRPAARPASSSATVPAVEPPLPEPDLPPMTDPAATSYLQPPRAAIEYLRAHPELALDFEAKYGPGSSQAVLGR